MLFITYNFSEVGKTRAKFKPRKVLLTIDETLEIVKFINAGTSYTVPVTHKVTRYLSKWVRFAYERVRSLYETHSSEKPNVFEREGCLN